MHACQVAIEVVSYHAVVAGFTASFDKHSPSIM